VRDSGKEEPCPEKRSFMKNRRMTGFTVTCAATIAGFPTGRRGYAG